MADADTPQKRFSAMDWDSPGPGLPTPPSGSDLNEADERYVALALYSFGDTAGGGTGGSFTTAKISVSVRVGMG